MKTLILLLFPLYVFSQEQYNFSVSGSSRNSLTFEFKTSKQKQSTIYGAGISVFRDKGNKGADYTGFITNLNNAYETIYAREGAIFFLIGDKITNNLSCLFRFGLGSRKIYINGKGIGTLPDELWYVRKKDAEDILCGLLFEYKIGFTSIQASWDSFNSFGLGLGINFKNNIK